MDNVIVKDNVNNLRFDGSLWCNMDIALRNLDRIFAGRLHIYNLSVIEWYVLLSLYELDGQHASQLARGVGRAATSFTPNLDKLQKKDFIERRADEGDRRAIRIFLTDKGRELEEPLQRLSKELNEQLKDYFNESDYRGFLLVLQGLQQLNNA